MTENQGNDNAESQMDVSASEEQNPSQSQSLLHTPSQATPSYAGVVQAEPTHSSPGNTFIPIQRPSKPPPPPKPAPPTPGKRSHDTTAADSDCDPEEAKRQIMETSDHDEPASAEQEMADGETENTEQTDANTSQPSDTQEKSPVTPPSGKLFKSFMNAMATTGFDRSNLMRKLKGPEYYTCRGPYLL